jgi:sterol desaturase/sphingolipid hydroxylase (fatty acid hydroxylase superfamily)
MANLLVSVAVLTTVYLLVAVLERTPALAFRPLDRPRPYLGTDTAWYVIALAASAVSALLVRPRLRWIAVAPLAHVVRGLPAPGQFALAVIVFDGASFFVHRWLHRSDLLWNVHKVHHSTLQLDALAATRAHMFENMIRFVPAQAAVLLVGVRPALVTPTVALAAVYGMFNHSNLALDLQWVEGVFVTPRLHRRHHVPNTSQNNFGSILTVWDRLARTLLHLDTALDERFGVPGEIDSYPQRLVPALREPLRTSVLSR